MNYGDRDGSEIISGDEGNLVPVENLSVEANDESGLESTLEPIADPIPASELVDESAAVALEVAGAAVDEPKPEPNNPVEPAFGVTEQQIVVDQTQPSGWQRIRSFLLGGSADAASRLNKLTQAIEDAPEASVNYVLRAELYMDLREYALAQADFQRAYELSDTQFELADWGLLEQAMRDRALTGLDKVKRWLR